MGVCVQIRCATTGDCPGKSRQVNPCKTLDASVELQQTSSKLTEFPVLPSPVLLKPAKTYQPSTSEMCGGCKATTPECCHAGLCIANPLPPTSVALQSRQEAEEGKAIVGVLSDAHTMSRNKATATTPCCGSLQAAAAKPPQRHISLKTHHAIVVRPGVASAVVLQDRRVASQPAGGVYLLGLPALQSHMLSATLATLQSARWLLLGRLGGSCNF